MNSRLLIAAALALPVLLVSCRSTGASTTPRSGSASDSGDRDAIRAMIDELYEAFCFDANAEPDWATQRRLYLEGATFVPPADPGRAPAGETTDEFIEGFRAYATGGAFAERGFHERITGVHVDVFGRIAHAFVAFEGFVPADGEAVTRGVDGIQLIKDGESWRLVSFTTQYEGDGALIPEDFPRGPGN